MSIAVEPPLGSKNSPVAPRSANRLLAALSPLDFARIERHLDFVPLERGQVLFDPGNDVTVTHFPAYRTMISMLIVTSDGHEIEAATVGREGAVGGIVSAGAKPAFGRAQVRIAGSAFAVPTAVLEETKCASPSFGELFSRYADTLIAQMMQSVACNALHSVEERCCRWLLAAHDRAGKEILQLTQENLAEMLGVQRTTVTVVIQGLEAKGVVRRQRGRVEIIDRQALERCACECYRAVEDHFGTMLPEVVL
jgi:CRP-like cAMP-binding protein